jgi:methionyl aminopeptidase
VIELKTPDEIELMRHADQITATALAAVRDAAAVGVRLNKLDEVAAEVIAAAGAEALFLGYHPSSAPSPNPGVTCIKCQRRRCPRHPRPLHPRPRRLGLRRLRSPLPRLERRRRHILHRRRAPRPQVTSSDQALIATTQAALDAGIAAAQPGARLGDIAHAIGQVARTAGYGLMESHGGHGIGREMHEAPHVPNDGRPGRCAPGWCSHSSPCSSPAAPTPTTTTPTAGPCAPPTAPAPPTSIHRRHHPERPRGPHTARNMQATH